MKTEFNTRTKNPIQEPNKKNKTGAGSSCAFLASGFRDRRSTRIGTALLEEEMNRMAKAYEAYGDLYQDFRKIRHDFANYVQTLELLQDEESRQARKGMKKDIVQRAAALMPRLEQTCAWKELMQSREQQEADVFRYMRTHRVSPLLRLLWQQWERQKNYFVHLDEELPQISQAIWKIKDKLECSLDPDEQEIDELLEGCDQFKKQIDVSDPVLASLLVDKMQRCRQAGIDFRFKLTAPEYFTMSYPDMLGLYGGLLDRAIEAAASSQIDHPLVRIRSGEQYGLWHLHVEYVHAPCTEADRPVQNRQQKQIQKLRGRIVKNIIKKYKAELKYRDNLQLQELDVVKG